MLASVLRSTFLYSMCALADSGVPNVVQPLPLEFPRIQGAEIAASSYGNRAGGDLYDCFRVGAERILFGLLDVAGRRETNQPIVEKTQEIFRKFAAELFSPTDINESEAMVTLCLHLNRGIIEQAAGVHSCPAFIGCYHERFGTLCYSNAGHTPGLLRDATGITELASTGLPLGLFSHATCEAPTVGMEKCAAILLVSRGVVEDSSGRDEDSNSGFEGTKSRLKTSSAASAQALCTAILNGAVQATDESSVREDMTALALLRTA